VAVPKQSWVKTIWILTSLIVISFVAITALAFGFIAERNSSAAKSESLRISKCVNNVLALRQSPSASDSSAYQAIFAAINDVIIASPGAAQQAAFLKFEKTLATNQVILNRDQAFRNAHPLGLC
jgi:hypothetical protein